MTFIEAAKKSKWVRRKGLAKHLGSSGVGWIDAELCININSENMTGARYITYIDLMSDDWEYSQQITISKEQFMDACGKLIKDFYANNPHSYFYFRGPLSQHEELAKELGFE